MGKKMYALLGFVSWIYAVTQASVITSQVVECDCVNPSTPDQCNADNTIHCTVTEPERANCFVLWSQHLNGTSHIEMKGCFNNNDNCNQTECVDQSASRSFHNLNFCCCKGNMCNREHKWIPITTTKAPEIELPKEEEQESFIMVVVACTVIILLLIIMGAVFMFYRRRKPTMFNEIPTNEPDITGSNQTLNCGRPITLKEMKARGRFGAVWRAELRSLEVAVKIFPLQDENSWVSEQEIYKLARMKHPNILEFIGVERRVNSEFWLITAYHNLGSLCDYLKANTVSWPELCRIAESMSRGLMHLHEEISESKLDGLKPAVAHRDFKSKNVLLKSDLSACIADFGLALIFQPGKSCGDTHGQVGTRRYMAPEVLEGAINFTRDAFLRIDVYACGLVLWELVSRCKKNPGDIVPEYTLPFETELGLHPTLEEMQENVVTKKLRPQILDAWRSHPGLNTICDTIEECWDHDAEARLSSSCVMERVSQHTRFPQSILTQQNELKL